MYLIYVKFATLSNSRLIGFFKAVDHAAVDSYRMRYDTVDLYSGVNSNELLRLAFQARDQIAAFLFSCTVVA